jgi:hypothetical protein
MLQAFSFDRNYPTTIEWGDHLAKHVFDGYFYQARGRELAVQLRTRRTDFGAFALPDSATWDSMSHGLTREEQINFLCAHLRLLNCFQGGQPGGVGLHEKQYAEASHLRWDFDEPKNPSARVINPQIQLERLRLSIGDIPALLPSLADRNFMPTYEFWRDFHPDRQLFRVSDIAEMEINDLTRQPLVDAEYFAGLTEATKTRYRERVLEWARKHVDYTDDELDLETLETTAEQNAFWEVAERLANNGVNGAVPILQRRMGEFPDIRPYVVDALRKLHVPDGAP